MQVKDIMTKKVVTVPITMEVHELARLFIEKDISGAPVVDEQGHCLGVVTEEGLIFQDKRLHLPTVLHLSLGFFTLGIRRLNEEMKKITGTTVGDIMEKETHAVSRDTPVEDIATMIVEKRAHYFPVIENECVVGVVTRKDIVCAIAKGIL